MNLQRQIVALAVAATLLACSPQNEPREPEIPASGRLSTLSDLITEAGSRNLPYQAIAPVAGPDVQVELAPPVGLVEISESVGDAISFLLADAGVEWRGDLSTAFMILPASFEVVNAQLVQKAGEQQVNVLDPGLHAYALALPFDPGALLQPGDFFDAMIVPVPWAGDVEPPEAFPEPVPDPEPLDEFLRFLILLQFALINDPPQPCNVAVPDTSAAIQAARARFTRAGVHTSNGENAAPNGGWAKVREITLTTPQGTEVRTNLKGKTYPYYKISMGVGCVPATNKWKVGISEIDFQYRILISTRNATNRPGADPDSDGVMQTPGGIEGTLGHEAEHGESMAEAVNRMLSDIGQGMSVRWNEAIGRMSREEYDTRGKAESAMRFWQSKLNKIMQKAIDEGGGHADPGDGPNENAMGWPRNGTAEPIDDDNQPGLDDEQPFDEIQEQMETLENNGYQPGRR